VDYYIYWQALLAGSDLQDLTTLTKPLRFGSILGTLLLMAEESLGGQGWEGSSSTRKPQSWFNAQKSHVQRLVGLLNERSW